MLLLQPVNGFVPTAKGLLTVWAGEPDCEAAQGAIAGWFASDDIDLDGTLADCPEAAVPTQRLPNQVKGNVGEFIAYVLGRQAWALAPPAAIPFLANALRPLSRISQPHIDIAWAIFAENPADDMLILQEVKTTGDDKLLLADRLIVDYQKLFSPDDPRLNLGIRLMDMKRELKRRFNMPDFAQRLTKFAGINPQTCSSVQLIPTLIHERDVPTVDSKMNAVQAALAAEGWPVATVSTWAIGLSSINDRLYKLASGMG